MMGSCWVGASVATLQDLVLPRMRATAGATAILGTSMVGLALGPYVAGTVAKASGSLVTGIAALYVVPPITLVHPVVGVAAGSPSSRPPARSAPSRDRLARLLRRADHRAGNPVAAIAARVGLVIVGLGVDHQRRPVGIHDRHRAVCAISPPGSGICCCAAAVGPISILARSPRCAPSRIVAAMLAVGRVPMRAGALEFRRVALAGRRGGERRERLAEAQLRRNRHADAIASFLPASPTRPASVGPDQPRRRGRRSDQWQCSARLARAAEQAHYRRRQAPGWQSGAAK